MRMNEITFEAQPPIDGYGDDGFRISSDWIEGAILILPSGVARFDGALTRDAIAPVLDAAEALDVVLFGVGREIAALPRDLRSALEGAALGVEVMSTPSACRTYNVLLTEDRRVAAVLLPVSSESGI